MQYLFIFLLHGIVAIICLNLGRYIYSRYRETKGCLYNKTPQQKEEFFTSLSNFVFTDEQFFKEQFFDLTPGERKQFAEWSNKRTETLTIMKAMVDSIAVISEEKKKQDEEKKIHP